MARLGGAPDTVLGILMRTDVILRACDHRNQAQASTAELSIVELHRSDGTFPLVFDKLQ
jgi:hypothetical protein